MTDDEIIERIVNKVVSKIDLTSLQKCQAELQALREQNRRLEQNFSVYQELAERRGKQSEQLTNQIKELEFQVASLTSVVENFTNG